MGRTGTKVGSKGRNWPEGERGTRKVGWRLSPASIAAVETLAEELHEVRGVVAEALLEVGARHRDELLTAIQARKETST